MLRRVPFGPAAAIGAVVLWSTNAYAADVALGHLSVLQLLTVQYGAAALALAIVRSWVRRRAAGRAEHDRDREPGPAIGRAGRLAPLLVGILGLTGTIFLQYLAFDTAPLVGANVICYADGLIAALWVAVWRPSRNTLIGLPLAVVGFAGVVVVFTDRGLGGLGGVEIGYLFALGSAACMAFYSLASGRLTTSTFTLLIPATTVGAAVALAASLARGEAWPPVGSWVGAAYIGLGPMAAGYALWTYAMSEGRADRLIPLSYATPLLSTALLLVTGQPFTGRTLLGAGMILLCSGGVLVNEWHFGRRSGRARAEAPEPAGASTESGWVDTSGSQPPTGRTVPDRSRGGTLS